MVSSKQTLLNRDKELAATKAHILKLQSENKHLVTKGVEAKKVIKKVKALQKNYNELNQAHFKSRNDFKALWVNNDRLVRDYGKMETINVQQEQTLAGLDNTYL